MNLGETGSVIFRKIYKEGWLSLEIPSSGGSSSPAIRPQPRGSSLGWLGVYLWAPSYKCPGPCLLQPSRRQTCGQPASVILPDWISRELPGPLGSQTICPLKVTRCRASLCLPRALSWQKWRHHILAQPRLSIYEGFLTNRQAGHAWVTAFIPHLACLHRTSTISTD